MRFFSRKQLLTLLFLPIAVGTARPQTLSGMPPSNSTVEDPIKGTNAGLPAPSRSYFLGGINVSTGGESNPSLLSTYSSQIASVTNLLGNFSLRKFWRHFATSIDYEGGDTLYRNYGRLDFQNQQFQRLSADGVVRWTRGQMSVKDLFSYTGSRWFGSSSAPGGIGNPTNIGSEFFGAAVFAPSYLSNVTVASISEALTKRSSASFSAAYSFTNYVSNSQGLFNSRQASSQTGYTYQISRRNNIGVLYGYQDFQFIPNVQSVVTNSAQFVFKRRFTDHLDVVLGGGPDRIVTTGFTTQSRLNAMAQASVIYRRRKSYLDFSYNRMVTSGSGVYAGGISDTATASLDRSLSRSWLASIRGGYDRTSGLGVSSFGLQLPQSRYWFAGLNVRRRLGRSLGAFASYDFNYNSFLTCAGSQSCGPGANRNIALIGLDWSIRPVHLE